MKRPKSTRGARSSGTRKKTKTKPASSLAKSDRAPQQKGPLEREKIPAEEKLLASFAERRLSRHRPPEIKMKITSGQAQVEWVGDPETALLARLATFGTVSPHFQSQTLGELWDASLQKGDEREINGMLAAMHGIAPRDEIEGMLAAQMVATHKAAMRCLARLKGAEMIPQHDSSGNLAIKLLRTYATLMETLQRYRGKGEQKVVVEHVHVHEGGQAIVGNVHQGSGGSTKTEDRPHAPALTYEPRTPLPCPDTQWEAVPVTSGERQTTLSNARRRGR
jgi:hypothetical protein